MKPSFVGAALLISMLCTLAQHGHAHCRRNWVQNRPRPSYHDDHHHHHYYYHHHHQNYDPPSEYNGASPHQFYDAPALQPQNPLPPPQQFYRSSQQQQLYGSQMQLK